MVLFNFDPLKATTPQNGVKPHEVSPWSNGFRFGFSVGFPFDPQVKLLEGDEKTDSHLNPSTSLGPWNTKKNTASLFRETHRLRVDQKVLDMGPWGKPLEV